MWRRQSDEIVTLFKCEKWNEHWAINYSFKIQLSENRRIDLSGPFNARCAPIRVRDARTIGLRGRTNEVRVCTSHPNVARHRTLLYDMYGGFQHAGFPRIYRI
jgi:hypothetical protein